jgi:DEAD/DEAH box helicase domain-containing protein
VTPKHSPPVRGDKDSPCMAVPEPKDRLSMDKIIEAIQNEDWYSDQIIHRRTIDAKEGEFGLSHAL